ncbi:MAG: ATP-dependent helicase [Deltaproteobacteria bacterium]|nr:ATP-dependent helicase [Deltaproteobacteria bacterium]
MTKSEKNFRISYTDALNPSQLKAVTCTRGPLLVIAGAGSGKTRTLTFRVARLVEEGIPPGSILLLTFTRKAAGEMLKRASKLLDERCERVAGGTFHSFANMVLRRFSSRIGFDSSFVIMDRSDTESLIGMLRRELGYGKLFGAFPKKQTLATIFSRSLNKSLSIEEVILNDYPHFEPFMEEVLQLYRAYGKQKREHSFLDFDDLLILLRNLLAENQDVRSSLSRQYQYLMVDEYQDTNAIQAEIIYLLAGPEKNVMVVGDDSQSIYAFRGANFRNIMEFPKRFPGTKIVRIEENYRSVQPILKLANVIIDRAAEKYTKVLYTRKQGGVPPTLVRAADENHQSRFVVETIKKMVRKGIPYEQIAVLFRAGFHSFDLEIELGKQGLPFVKVGGFKFMESAHIKDVLAYLRVLLTCADRLSWYRILLLIENIGPQTAQKIYDTISKKHTAKEGINAVRPHKSYSKPFGRLNTLFQKLDVKSMSVAQLGEVIIEYYEPLMENRFDDYPKRMKDLEQLLSIMARYHRVDLFLADMALEPPNTSMDDVLFAGSSSDNRLTLSTIHSAKGLEWNSVFIIWALDGRFPSAHGLERPEELEEELRLMYVATTRAKEYLYIVYPMQVYTRGLGMASCTPSRFVEGIPETILQRQSFGRVNRQRFYSHDDHYWR